MVTFGLDPTLRVLRGLGFDVAQTAKTAEQVLAVATLFLAGMLIGLLLFVLVRSARRGRVRLYGLAVGGAAGAFSVAVSLAVGTPAGAAGKAVYSVLVLAILLAWGWGLACLLLVAFPMPTLTIAPGLAAAPTEAAKVGESETAPPEGPVTTAAERIAARARVAAETEARAISRRRFLIQMGGLAAVIVVAGADVGRVLGTRVTPPTAGPPQGVTQSGPSTAKAGPRRPRRSSRPG